MAIVVGCKCGAKLKISEEQVRRGIKCPKCGQGIRAKASSASAAKSSTANSTPSSSDDWDGTDDDPLGLGDIGSLEAGATPQQLSPQPAAMPQSPVNAQPQSTPLVSLANSAPTAPRKPAGKWGQNQVDPFAGKQSSTQSFGTIELIAAIFGIVHALIVNGYSAYTFITLFQYGLSFGILAIGGLVIQLPYIAASIGIGIASVGLIMKAPWSKKVAFISSIGFLACTVLFFGLGVISMIQGQIAMAEMSQELSELGLQDSSIAQDAQRHATYLTARALIFSIPRWIIILVAPIMMVVLFRKQDGSD